MINRPSLEFFCEWEGSKDFTFRSPRMDTLAKEADTLMWLGWRIGRPSHELRWEQQGDVFVIDEYYQFKATEPDDPDHNPDA